MLKIKLIPLLALAAIGLQGCLFSGLQKDSDAFLATISASGAGGLEVFTAEVFPLFAQAACTKCHATSQSPLFAVADVAQSYSVSKGLANFEDPAKSKLVVKAADSHYGATATNLGSAPWADAVTKWADAEIASGGVSGGGASELVTGVFNIPVPFSTPNPRDFSIPLDSLGPDFNQTALIFRLELGNPAGTGFKTADAVQITRLRFQNNSGRGFDIGGIKVYQDGQFIVGQHDSFITTSSLVAPNSNIIISGNYMILPMAQGLSIKFAFQKLKSVAFNGCQQLPLFVSNFRTAVMNSDCIGCHGGGAGSNATATTKFNMALTDADSSVCARALQHSNLTAPSDSAILRQPCNGANGHPTQKPNNGGAFSVCTDPAKYNNAINWISQE